MEILKEPKIEIINVNDQEEDEDEEDDEFNEESLQIIKNIDLLNINKKLLKNSFSTRVRSLSNDFLRTIEYAHGCTDLHNSTFAVATQAQAQNQISLTNNGINNTTINDTKKIIQSTSSSLSIDNQSNNDNNNEELGIVISIWEVFVYIWGCLAFFIDIISDIVLANTYFKTGKKWLGFLTLVFVIVPNVTLTLFSLSWYIDTYKAKRAKWKQESKDDPSKSVIFWLVTIFLLAFQLELIIEYIKGLIYTVKAWVYRKFYKNIAGEKYYLERQIKCDVDIGMLRIIEVFMDSGPQVLLQLYVIITQKFINDNGDQIIFSWSDLLNHENQIVLKQLISIFSSLFSMSYAIAGYHRCLRNQQYIFCFNTNKRLPKPISWWATIMEFIWYLFLISPRVLSMALFASVFRSWFFIIIFIHWSCMYFWILGLKTNYCLRSDTYSAREEIFEKFYNFVCAFIYIFVFFNVKQGSTRYRYLIYYILFYLENILFSVNYFIFTNEESFIFKLLLMLICLVGFWLAVLFQSFYYIYLHPSQDYLLCYRPTNTNIQHKTSNTSSSSLSTSSSNVNKDCYFIYKISKRPSQQFISNKSNKILKFRNKNDYLAIPSPNSNTNDDECTPKDTSASNLPTISSQNSINTLLYQQNEFNKNIHRQHEQQDFELKFKNAALINYKLNEYNQSISSFSSLFNDNKYQQTFI